MLRTARVIAVSAVVSVVLLAVAASAMAMPAPEPHGTAIIPDRPAAVASPASHDDTLAVWLAGGALVVALVSAGIAVSGRRSLGPVQS